MGALWALAVQQQLQQPPAAAAAGEDREEEDEIGDEGDEDEGPGGAGRQLVAYGGEDGEVGLFWVEYEGHSKRRMKHKGVAGGWVGGDEAGVGG